MKYKVIHGNVLWQCWMWPWCAINLHFCRQGPPVNVTKASAKKEIQIKYKATSAKKKEIKVNIKRPMPKKWSKQLHQQKIKGKSSTHYNWTVLINI